MVKVKRYSIIGYRLVPKWIKSVPQGLGKFGKIHTHGSQDAERSAQVWSQYLVYFVEEPITR
jgi:hypothetical protein